jgi:hypothetical protein
MPRNTSSIFSHNDGLEGSQRPEGQSVRDDHDARAGKYQTEPRTRIDEPSDVRGDRERRRMRMKRMGMGIRAKRIG